MKEDEFKICPFCKEKIRIAAVKCRFCGEWLEQPVTPVSATTPPLVTTEKIEAVPEVTAQPSQEDFALGEKVFRDLANLLNIYPSQEAWERKFQTRKNSTKPISSEVLEELWLASDVAGRKPLLKPVEKKVESPALKFLDVAPKKLYLAGTGFLFLGIVIIVWIFEDVDFSRGDPDKVTSLMAAMILKPILGAAALAWAVHGSFGKRKGYMFLVFAITWALVMVWCAINLREGFNESRAKSKAEHNQVTTLASNFLEYAQNEKGGSFDKVKASLNDNKDSISIPVTEFSKNLIEAVEKKTKELPDCRKGAFTIYPANK